MYAWLIQFVEPEKIDEFHFQLDQPLPGREKKVTPMQLEDEGASFMAMYSAVKGA